MFLPTGSLIAVTAALQQHLGSIAHYNHFVLVHYFVQESDNSTLGVALAPALDSLPYSYRVADKYWLYETEPIQAIKRDHGVVGLSHSDGQSGRHREDERPVSYSLTEGATGGQFLVCMDLVPVSGQCRKVDYVGLGNCSPG